MADRSGSKGSSLEVEFKLKNGAELDLQTIKVDADETPLAFLVEGHADEIDGETVRRLRENSITPFAVRFEFDDEPAEEDKTSERTFTTTYSDEEPVTLAIVRGLAVVEGVEPTELDPLYESVDPDRIDQFFGTPRESSSEEPAIMAFNVSGYRVTVRNDGSITIQEGNASE